MILNSKVKELREQKGVNQAILAKLLETSLVNYSKKEKGTIKFSLAEAKKISDYFDLPIEVIFFDDKVSKSDTA